MSSISNRSNNNRNQYVKKKFSDLNIPKEGQFNMKDDHIDFCPNQSQLMKICGQPKLNTVLLNYSKMK